MQKDSAKNLIQDTLQNSFNKERFIYFVKNLLNSIDELKAFHARGYVPEIFKDYVKTYERLGTYTDPEEKKIDILIVYLQRESTLERARTAQRNFIARYLKDRGEKDAGLIAFVSPNKDDWRFSFVKMEYTLTETPKGTVKAKEEFTPARRYSFLVGMNENSYTTQSRLLPLLLNDEVKPTLAELEETFSVERVTKEFFEKYRDLFLRLKESLDEIIEKDAKVSTDFKEKNIDAGDFAKKLLGQIVFLYFLQKKGWFGVPRGKDWGEGDKKFLRNFFDKAQKENENYFNRFLKLLFYEALRSERPKDYYDQFNCRIPFLNGGLFDPINDYDWQGININLPNEIFSNHRKTKEGDTGDGILDVFDRYNFTVKEDEPLEKEVAIDPEMLGKVFENLLEVKDRKSKGTYYTPREIVHYMCQESLVNYLVTELEGKASKEEIKTLIKYGETAVEHDSRVVNEGRETKDYSFKLPKSIRKHAKLIDEKLKTIRVCDPAVGSGAFVVGMMNEIIRTRDALTPYLFADERTPYNFKRQAIQNCLYGVDIDHGAVEIAKLRLWLSLIVDEEDIKKIKPLPNLDYKIMQGNSLLSEFMGINFDKEDDRKNQLFISQDEVNTLIEKLKDKKDEYLNKARASEKQQLKQEIEDLMITIFETKLQKQNTDYSNSIKDIEEKYKNLPNAKQRESLIQQERENLYKISGFNLDQFEKQLREYTAGNKLRPFFPWHLYFAEVFHEKKGFDVVIANPPYVEHKKLKSISGLLKRSKVYSGTADLYVYFYEVALNILREAGILTFISSNKFIRARYGSLLRELLAKNRIRNIVDFTEVKVFDALVASCIILVSKKEPAEDVVVTFADDTFINNLADYIIANYIKVPANSLDGEIWQLEDKDKIRIKEHIESASTKLGKIKRINIYRGITTGYNPAFIIDEDTRSSLIAKDKKNKEIIKPLLQGRDIRKWTYRQSAYYLLQTGFDRDIRNEFPYIFSHLSNYEKELKKRDDQGKNWWNLRACRYYPEFEKEKIIWGLTANKWAFAYDNRGHYLPSNGYILTSSSLSVKYLLAMINSMLMEFYFGFIGIMTAGGAYTLKHETIANFPIKEISEPEQKPFIDLVDKILAITKDDDYLENLIKQAKVREYEKQIDQLVYNLYGLTPEEIKIVERGNQR